MAEQIMAKYNSLETIEEKRKFFETCTQEELIVLVVNDVYIDLYDK